MALFSDIDWVILLAAGAFLLFGRENRTVLRTLGRYYGRAVRLKQELLAQVSEATEIPLRTDGRVLSVRSTLLGLDSPAGFSSGIPAAVAKPPGFGSTETLASWAGLPGSGTWSVALPPTGRDPGRSS